MKPQQQPLCLDRWWPEPLGAHPDWIGAIEGVRYAYFSESARLVLEHDGAQDIYDTGEHRLKSADPSHWTMTLQFRDATGEMIGLGEFRHIGGQ